MNFKFYLQTNFKFKSFELTRTSLIFYFLLNIVTKLSFPSKTFFNHNYYTDTWTFLRSSFVSTSLLNVSLFSFIYYSLMTYLLFFNDVFKDIAIDQSVYLVGSTVCGKTMLMRGIKEYHSVLSTDTDIL